MTDHLQRLIDAHADQAVINERLTSLLQSGKAELERIGTDHEKRLRFLERTLNYGLGAIGMISAILYLASVLNK